MKATSACNFAKRGARINRVCGQRNCIAQVIGLSGGDEGGGGVEQHDVAAGGFLPGQYFADQRGVASGVSAGYVIERGALQAEFLGRNFVAMNLCLAHLGDARWGGDGDFVQAVTSVDNERATQTLTC